MLYFAVMCDSNSCLLCKINYTYIHKIADIKCQEHGIAILFSYIDQINPVHCSYFLYITQLIV